MSSSDSPLFTVPRFLTLIRSSQPACRTLAASLFLAWLSIEYLSHLWQLPLADMAFNSSPEIWDGQGWRLLTAPFVHDGAMHLMAVVLTLLFFGPLLEALLGTGRFVLLCLWAACLSQLTSLALGATPTCGASPLVMAICGALGMGMTLRSSDFDDDLRSVLPFGLLATVFLLGALSVCDLAVNAASHLGGLLGGLMLTPLLVRLPWELPSGMRAMMLSSMMVMVVCLMSIAMTPRPDEMSHYLQQEAIDQYEQQRWAAAQAVLKPALDLQPEDPHVRAVTCYLQAFLAYQSGHPQTAESWFRQAVTADPEYADAWSKLADLAQEQCEGSKALAWLKQEAILLPRDPHIPLTAGSLRLEEGDTAEAERDFQRALTLKGADPEAHLARAQLFAAEGKSDPARQELALAGDSPEAAILTADLNREARLPDPDSVLSKLLQKGVVSVKASLWEGNYQVHQLHEELARQAYRRALSIEPDNREAILALGDLWRDMGLQSGARHCYEVVLRSTVRNQEERIQHGDAALALGNVDEALRSLEAARQACPHRADLQALQARLQQSTGQLAAARESWRTLITAAPDQGDAWFELGWTASKLGNKAQAAACFDRAIALARQPRDELLARGWSALLAGREDEAGQRARQLLDHQPGLQHAQELAAASQGVR